MHVISSCPTQPAQRYATILVPVPTDAAGGYYPPAQRDFLDSFYEAYAAWRSETEHLSSITEKVGSPHFRAIVDLGDRAIPLIVHELRKRPNFIFLALQQITGEDPVPKGARGNVRAMVEAWLLWAERADVNAD